VLSAAAKLCGFLILLAVVFAGAYAAGARLGPVTTSYSQPAGGGSMNMGGPGPAGGQTPPAARIRGGR